jgi:hypothetical protein
VTTQHFEALADVLRLALCMRAKHPSYNSTPRNIKYGIPQGSILGLLLFLLHINDLPEHISNSKVVLFADYTNILAVDKNINTL